VLTQLVTAQVQLLRSLQATIGELGTAIKQRVAQHPRANLLRGLPGVAATTVAASVGPILDRVSTAEQAAAACGAAPVTRASGKTSGVYFRWAGNPRAPGPHRPDRLRGQRSDAVTLGRPALCRRPRSRQTQPPRHPHRRPRLAPRHLGLLAHATPYDPCSHLAEQRLTVA
jgi:transposase